MLGTQVHCTIWVFHLVHFVVIQYQLSHQDQQRRSGTPSTPAIYFAEDTLNSSQTVSHLFCTLISGNQGLDKSRSASNLIKTSVPVHLNFFFSAPDFFSVCHLNFFQVYGTNLKKKSSWQNEKKIRSTEKKIQVCSTWNFSKVLKRP